MFTAINVVLIFFISALGFAQSRSLKPEHQEVWRRYLQYPSTRSTSSLIKKNQFFLNPEGSRNPEAEWESSILEMEKKEEGDNSFSCQFPARKKLMEKLIGQKFPEVDCPDLQRWIKAFGNQKIWIIYAGAYRNNPASLFGHTFLRFDKEVESDPSRSLRSQSVGFLADTPTEDGQTETVIKGLLGAYQGYFNIQPYYMQTALYNNAEARSLWEFELDLTEDEKKWAVLYLWELSFRGSMTYRFLNENCSYHLLGFLEAIRPGTYLTSESGFFVLPLETVRLLEKKQMLKAQKPIYQASIRTRLQSQLQTMTNQQKQQYRQARVDLKTLQKIQDRTVLDALTEYQTFYNYQKKTQLSPNQRRIFDQTFIQRAQLGSASEEKSIHQSIGSPLESHRPSWWQVGVASRQQLRVLGLMGAHDLISSMDGVEDSSTMEYMGLQTDWSFKKSEFVDWEFMLARARTLNSWSLEEPLFSWSIDGFWQEFRAQGRWLRGVNTGAGGGLSWTSWNRDWVGALFLEARVQPGLDWKANQVGLGPWALLRYENRDFSAALEFKSLFFGSNLAQEWNFQLMPKMGLSRNLKLLVQWKETQLESETTDFTQAALRYYF